MCDCIDEVNKQLAPQGYKLCQDILFDTKGHLDVSGPFILTEPIVSKTKKIKYMHLFPAYCPFCGKAYPNKDEAQA